MNFEIFILLALGLAAGGTLPLWLCRLLIAANRQLWSRSTSRIFLSLEWQRLHFLSLSFLSFNRSIERLNTIFQPLDLLYILHFSIFLQIGLWFQPRIHRLDGIMHGYDSTFGLSLLGFQLFHLVLLAHVHILQEYHLLADLVDLIFCFFLVVFELLFKGE